MLITQLQSHLDASDITITLTKKDNIITAIVLPKPKNDKLSGLSPIVVKGTAEELDANLAASLGTVFKAINEFKVEGIEAVIKEIKAAASKADKTVKKEAEPKIEKPAKVNPKTLFDDASKLFKDGKYSEALPLYQSAFDNKSDSKQYKEALDLCQKWVNRIEEANLFEDNVSVNPIQDNIAEVVPEEEFPVVDEQGDNGPTEDNIEEELGAENVSEDDEDFPI